MDHPSDGGPTTPKDLIVRFYYSEIKDLSRTGMTLVAGTLVFSVTFADRIINFQSSRFVEKLCLVAAWVAMIASYSTYGYALRYGFQAAVRASDDAAPDVPSEPLSLVRKARRCLRIGAKVYRVGLILLALTAVLRLFF